MTLEFTNELGDIRPVQVKPRHKSNAVSPLVTGDTAPFFSLSSTAGEWRSSLFNHAQPATSVSLLSLVTTKPVVISFYCPCWGAYAEPHLDALIRLNDELQKSGAELIVLSNESPKTLQRQGKVVDFLFAYDADWQVARQFGVYSEDNPVWDRVSGISDEAFVPALYVVGPDRQIIYHEIDENFDSPLNTDAVLEAVDSISASTPDLVDNVPFNPYSLGFLGLWLAGLIAAVAI
jgi:peroxiredoxin